MEEKNHDQKLKLLPFLVKNVIHPYGYSFLSYLVLENKTELIRAALEINGVKYLSDIYGINPL